ncbi:C40 family peptidase [Flavobacterium sp.]|uniref:C40 family peptidase n=1 Tax=Flavobacterium sp. TaxID=239 RepID=UPI00120ED4FD|nr:C40 family peptidase [Flavobacterium sp.]RZJ71617.1 MAG: NlpC/P60 family protein [Flavobacterium sp.]
MFVKKALFFFVPVFLLVATQSHAQQPITSKKEAQKKGVYRKPADENVSSDVKSAVSSFTGKEADKSSTKSTSQSSKTVVSTVIPQSPKPTATVAQTTPAPKPVAAKAVAAKPKSKKALINEKDDADIESAPEENYVAVQMINNALTFIGTRYLGGGTTTKGMDCSGMVTAVYRLFDMSLPRSSHEMAKVGEKVDRKDVKKGDLVFFHTNGKKSINHVGMVVEATDEEIKFVHSSTQKGVIVSSTKEPYYERNLVQCNRVQM